MKRYTHRSMFSIGSFSSTSTNPSSRCSCALASRSRASLLLAHVHIMSTRSSAPQLIAEVVQVDALRREGRDMRLRRVQARGSGGKDDIVKLRLLLLRVRRADLVRHRPM